MEQTATTLKPSLQPVGLIGLGRMGMPLARRLKERGWKVIAYRRRNTPNVEQWVCEGGIVTDSLSDLRECSALILSLPDTSDVRSVAQTLLTMLHPGTLILDTSTIHPSGARELARLACQSGVTWLDAPISGGPVGAAEGTLTVMIGGSPDGFERAKPLLADIGMKIVYLGKSGAGLICKLANNALLAVSALATCEALVLAAKSDLDPSAALDALTASSGYNRFMDTRGHALARTGIFEPAQFTVSMLLKDLRIAADAFAEIGFTPEVLHLALAAYERAEAMGLGEQDFSSVLRVVESKS